MLTWTKLGDTWTAASDLFEYTIKPVDGRFFWTLKVLGDVCGNQHGPYQHDKARQAIQKDFKNRMAQADVVYSTGKFSKRVAQHK